MLGGADHGMSFRGGEFGGGLGRQKEWGHGEVICRPSKQSRWWIGEERPLGAKNYLEGPGLPEGRQEHAGSRCFL